jgi:Protoglobin
MADEATRAEQPTPARTVPGYLPGTDMPRFIRDMMEFVGMSEADVAAIRRSAPNVLSHERELTTALYDHFIKFPRSAQFFLKPDGEVDQARLERRKHSLGRWLRETAEAAITHEFSYYLLSAALAHGHRAQPPGSIPQHLMVGAMSLTQSALAGIFAQELGAAEAAAASVAWNKLLLVQLSVFMLAYVPPRAIL